MMDFVIISMENLFVSVDLVFEENPAKIVIIFVLKSIVKSEKVFSRNTCLLLNEGLLLRRKV